MELLALIKALQAQHASAEVIQAEVDAWLEDHPEASTTVQDGAITYAKLHSDLQGAVDDVGDLKSIVTSQQTQINGKASTTDLAAETARAEAEEARIEALFTEPTQEAVDNWLDEHPEATTTVQDGSLTEAKFSDALKLKAIKDYVTPEMYGAKGDGVTDDTEAFSHLNGKAAYLGEKTYIVEALEYNSGTYIFGAGVGKTVLKLKNNAANKIVLSMVNADHSHIEGVTLDGNKANNATGYDTYDGVLVLRTTSGTTDYLNGSTFENIEIVNGGNIGLCLPYVSGNQNYNFNWCYSCKKIIIKNCNVGMYNMSSDNTFDTFNISGNTLADMICYKSGSNKYSNFKLDGESGRTKTGNDVPSGASLIFDQASNEEFTNLDVQSAYYHGIKVINSHNISLLGDINNCGTAYANETLANMDGIGISYYGSRDCKANLSFNIPNLPLQRTNVTINSSSHRISVEYIADMATYSQYPSKYISQSTDSSIVRKDYSADISTVTLTLSNSAGWSETVAYPSGFARGNCIGILSILNDTWRNGADVNGDANYRFFSSCETDGVRVYNNISTYYGAKAAVTLVRIAYSIS